MSVFIYETLRMQYTYTPGSGDTLVFLHGWGANGDSFSGLISALGTAHGVLTFDFPGFGKSDAPEEPWDVDRYTLATKALLNHLEIQAPVLVAHSFGGRVSIKLATQIPIKKLILIDSAGIKPKRTAGYYARVYGYKMFKVFAGIPILSFLLKAPFEAYVKLHSSADYQAAVPVMKQTLSRVVNEDLRGLLPKIHVPTLLIWGDADDATPLSDAHIMEAEIPDAGLVTLKGAGHFSYLEQPETTYAIMSAFLGGAE